VAVIGAGIVGCAVAAFLAEGGASVVLLDRETIAAGASGRNSGLLQHPMDPALAPLFAESVAHYRELEDHGFALAPAPNGMLLVGEQEDALAGEAAALQAAFPELRAELLPAGEPAALEPVLAPHLPGIRLETGHAVPPAAATRAFAARARAAGAEIRVGAAARPGTVDADVVVVAAGPWTPALVDPAGAWRPIAPLWGVVSELRLPVPPHHALEEAGIGELLVAPDAPPPLFSLITANGLSALGSTFLAREPEPASLVPGLRAHGARFVPALAALAPSGVRACARPLSADGRPLLGRAPGRSDLFVAAGHGPWGISLGPASGRLMADLVLGRVAAPPAAFDPARFGPAAD
jgi:glycine/D-amino acid oxidase-like deaminating enzyme